MPQTWCISSWWTTSPAARSRLRSLLLLAAFAALGVSLPAAAADGWRAHAPLPIARTEVAAAVLNGQIFVVGGYLADGSSTNEVDIYLPAADRWFRAPNLPAAVNHTAATSVGGRLFVAGGYGAERSAFVFDGKRWRTLHLPAARGAAGAAALRGVGYVVGGRGVGGLAKSVLAWNGKRWRILPGPTPREHLAVTAARGRVYAVGGRKAGYDTNLDIVESWAPGEKRWRREAPLPEARGGTGAAAVGGTIVSVGGEAPSGTLRAVFAFDVTRRTWRRLADLPTPRHGLGVVSFKGSVYVIGGGPQPGLHVSDANESLALAASR
jgi:N-acetylneuraminic acid mutarotase